MSSTRFTPTHTQKQQVTRKKYRRYPLAIPASPTKETRRAPGASTSCARARAPHGCSSIPHVVAVARSAFTPVDPSARSISSPCLAAAMAATSASDGPAYWH